MGTWWRSRAGALACGAVGALAVAVIVAMAALWPGDQTVKGPHADRAVQEHEAKVVTVRRVPCQTPQQRRCARAEATLTDGPERGKTASFDASTAGEAASIDVGDRVFLAANELPDGAPLTGVEPYTLTGFQRHNALLLLTAIFVGLVVVLGRLRGGLALVGLGSA